MTYQHDNRRSFFRAPLFAKVKFKDGNKEEVYTTDDLSEGGLSLKIENPPFKGTVLVLELTIPNTDKPMMVSGTVAWRVPGKGCGVRFLRISDEHRELIRAYVDSKKPPDLK